MEEDILFSGKKHVDEVRSINRDLTQKALHMRCRSYLSKVKEKLLVETIFEIDSSKKNLLKVTRDIEQQRDIIARQKEELEEKNLQLEQLKESLEQRVRERTADLEKVNRELRQEMLQRKEAEEEREKMRGQLLQSQKMESIGRLAGGVAHDFNNLLTAILGFSRLALLKLSEDDPLARDLNIILEAGEKGAALNRQLLAFSRKQTLKMTVMSMNRVVDNMINILGRMVGADMEIQFHPDQNLQNMMADVGQVEQVLLNLVVNARDAMPCGGRIVIETANVELDKEYARLHEGVKPGSYVMMAVTDTGSGMPAEVQAKVFDPFFTTKEKGKGTGLGLSTVHGIVKQHSGHIFVYSEVDSGTTFKIYFPATDAEGERQAVRQELSMPRGSETVLVVDDDPAIRRLVADTLQPLGYRILDAPCGEDALEVAQQYCDDIGLLLTDVIMPGMDGKALSIQFSGKCPKAKVVFMSGYTDNVLSGRGEFDSNVNYIQKPFSPTQLARELRLVLDG